MSQGEARALLENKLLNEILDKLEHEAFETCADAQVSDNELRLTSMLEVNAIRSLRGKLRSLADPVKPILRGSVA